MESLPYAENPVLFGADPKEGIVAVETVGEGTVRLYLRTPRGVIGEDDDFEPFLFLEKPELLRGWGGRVRCEPLGGSLDYRTAAFFPGWGLLQLCWFHEQLAA